MKFFLLAMTLLVGGASVAQGGLLGGLIGPVVDCGNVDLLCTVDPYYVSDLAYIRATLIELVTQLQASATTVSVTIVVVTGDVYTGYTPICSGVETIPEIEYFWDHHTWTGHNNNPWDCYKNGNQYGIYRHQWRNGYKKKHVQFCHDESPSVGGGRRKRGNPTNVVDAQNYENLMIAAGIDYGCVAYCPSCNPGVHTTFSLSHIFGALVNYPVWYCNSLNSLLAIVLDLVKAVLCLLLGILG